MRERRLNSVGRAATASVPRITLGGLRLAVLDLEQTANFMIDMTPSLMGDVGWLRTGGNAALRACRTDVPIEEAGGLIPGANVVAADSVCRNNVNSSRSSPAYKACMTTFADVLSSSGLLTGGQDASLRSCISRVN